MKTITRTLVVLLFVVTLLASCGKPQPKTFTIGVVNFSPPLDAVVEGFKVGMAELGYVEGENVTYVYEGVVTSIEALDPAVQNLRAADVDLILSLTTPATLVTRQAVEGTDVPVVFAGVNDPVASGLVKSLREAGGNLTGIQAGGSIAKGLEWLLAIAPDTTSLFVPYNPDDAASVQAMVALSEAAATLGVELLIVEVRTPDELAAALDAIPESADAMFVPSSGFLSARLTQVVETAILHKLPLASMSPWCKEGVLMSYGFGYYQTGEQASRLADKILQGTPPADLPVETADFFLVINLQTAQAIGLDIPDDILQQADEIIR